jgi:hypothetical protein
MLWKAGWGVGRGLMPLPQLKPYFACFAIAAICALRRS